MPRSPQTNPTGVASLLITLVVICGILVGVADFRFRQSIVLTVLLTLILTHRSREFNLAKEETAKFLEGASWKLLRHHVLIQPKWQQIVCDFKLVPNSEELDTTLQALNRALPNGISYTVLEPANGLEQSLVFDPQCGAFLGEVDFRKATGLTLEHTSGKLRLFVKPGNETLDLGIIVPEKWWNEAKGQCPAPVEEQGGDRFYETELTLARLPQSEFHWYHQHEFSEFEETAKPNSVLLYEAWKARVLSTRTEQRLGCGWSEVEPDGFLNARGVRIEHRYFEVSHQAI